MTQPNLLELAKQGDVQAIASLMNRQLQPKGITVKVALKDACLQVMLESAQVPNQQALVAFIRKGITGLGAASIERVKVYGRQTGEEFPAWNLEFDLLVQASSLFSANEFLNLVPDQNESLESPLLTKSGTKSNNNKNLSYKIQGSNGEIRLTHNRIIISRKILTALITQSLNSDKEIPIRRITAIQFKPADPLNKGYLQFCIEGSIELIGGVLASVIDENTVIFSWAEQPEFEEMKRYINSVIDNKPLDFENLRFSEFKPLKFLRIQEEKEAIKKVIASEKLFWRKARKLLLNIVIISFILACFALQGSNLKTLSAFSFVISGGFLCLALIKGY
ncbi:MAG: hypothetical protein V7K69_08870 [Nostoc sp.]|uniref:hypothetical protein n=1 Tax=Nostoc sp. TaxID=1180 RepID=UPI002FF70D49